MKVSIVTGSRADYGFLRWPIKLMEADSFFLGNVLKLWGCDVDSAYSAAREHWEDRPDLVMLVGDRFEILGAATAAHLMRIPIAHLCGGDVTLGSYDDAMRDCISRMATLHFPASTASAARLVAMGCTQVYLVGSTEIDYIKNADWRRERPHPEPYVVVTYYPETIDGMIDLRAVHEAVGDRKAIWVKPNPDAGSDRIPGDSYEHDDFLNLIWHCEELIGNSSALVYSAPSLGIKTRMIGKRQKGRAIPDGDGHASERMLKVLRHIAL